MQWFHLTLTSKQSQCLLLYYFGKFSHDVRIKYELLKSKFRFINIITFLRYNIATQKTKLSAYQKHTK